MSHNSDMIKLLTLMESNKIKFAGEPEQKPGDQVRGTDRAVSRGKQHPFHDRLVGEEINLEDKLAKRYQDMKDIQAKEKEEKEKEKVEETDKWIQRAVNPANKGDLHKALHVAQGEKIPKGKLEKASHSKNAHLRHMAQFAKNVSEDDVTGMALPGAPAAPGTTPPAAGTTDTTPAANAADAQQQKADRRKAIQDQINAYNKALNTLRQQLATIQ